MADRTEYTKDLPSTRIGDFAFKAYWYEEENRGLVQMGIMSGGMFEMWHERAFIELSTGAIAEAQGNLCREFAEPFRVAAAAFGSIQ